MKPPLFVGPLADQDKQQLEAGLRSPDAFTLRRSQILLASARGYRPSQIAPVLGCSVQGIRDAIRAFRAEGLGCLAVKSRAPKRVRSVGPGTAMRNSVSCCTRALAPSGSGGAPGPWNSSRRSGSSKE